MVICHATSLCSQSHHIHFSLGKMQKMSFSWGSTVPLLKFLMFFCRPVAQLPCHRNTSLQLYVVQWSWHAQLPWFGMCVQQLLNCIMLHPIANKARACAPPSSIPIMTLCKRKGWLYIGYNLNHVPLQHTAQQKNSSPKYPREQSLQ